MPANTSFSNPRSLRRALAATSSTLALLTATAVLLARTITGTCAETSQSKSEDSDRLRVLLEESGRRTTLWIRHAFSTEQDLMLRMETNPDENNLMNMRETCLVDRDAPLTSTAFDAGRVIHINGDDSTPWFINGTYIGGNHGCFGVIEIQSPNHGLTPADLGGIWRDANTTDFCLLAIRDPGTFWIMSDDKSPGGNWKFITHVEGASLTGPSGATLPVRGTKLEQLRPSCRINTRTFLADGRTPLVPGQITDCAFVDVIEDYDIIDPRSVLAEVKKNPGQIVDWTTAGLQAVLNNHITYRIYPNGATVISHKARALETFRLGHMGFVQQNLLWKNPGTGDRVEYYIPKTQAFQQDGTTYDFRGIQEFSAPRTSLNFSQDHQSLASSDNLPDRFIQLLSFSGTKRDAGFAMGYSLIEGITASPERSKHTRSAGFIHTTGKTYPRAIDASAHETVPEGTTFACTAYRQYFNPSLHPAATALYWHAEGGFDVVYLDYHRSVSNDLVKLPGHLTGRDFAIVEKTDSVTLHTSGTIPASGLDVSVADGYGYVVLKVK